jgi:Mu transposase, C-terminal domain
MVTDRLFRRLRKLIQTEDTLAKAADKASVDEKTARKYRDSESLPSQRRVPHTWRTRQDPFQDVWLPLVEQLRLNPGLQAKTLFDDLQRRFPGRFPDVQLRCLQRRIKQWRALEGPPKEVFFAQTHEPGRLAESDFTHMGELGVTIAGEPFDHLVYHFVLTYSNWEAGTVCFSESFESLSEGLQNALWELGGVPKRHRTDRLTAAVNTDPQPEMFTRRYQALLAHYGLEAQAIQPHKANENGDVEQSHHRFKQAVDQALMLRGSRDFASRGDYQGFLKKLMAGRNANRKERFTEERAVLSSLPARRLEMARRIKARVDAGSTIHVGGNAYSLPSRLIGEFVDVHVMAETLEVWHGARKIDILPRLRGRGKHRIEYRHIIDWLVRKPGAFEEYRYRDAMFPTSRFRIAYDILNDQRPGRAVKDYLAVLLLAAREGESGVDEALRLLLDAGRTPDEASVAEARRQGRRPSAVTDVWIVDVDLTMYDRLLEPGEDHEHSINRYEGAIDRQLEGAASAGDAGLFRGAGASGPAGVAELRALPSELDGAGAPGAPWPPDRAAPEGVATAAGEGPSGAGPEAAAAEGGAADPGPDGRDVRGPLRERAGVRQPGIGEDARFIGNLSRIDPFRTEGLFPELWADGPGSPGGQAGPEAKPAFQEPLAVRGPGPGRPGLRAAGP